MQYKGHPVHDDIDELYAAAVLLAGENPNALGFMRRHPPSKFYRRPPLNCVPQEITPAEFTAAVNAMRSAVARGRW